MNEDHDVLERNVSTLLETGGEAPRLSDVARARIRGALIAQHAVAPAPGSTSPVRKPVIAAGIGLAAAAVIAILAQRLIGPRPAAVPAPDSGELADGSTFVAGPGGKVAVLGPRSVRVEGPVLLDVAPGKGTFVVDTARGRIEVLGTRFMVDGEPERTTAAVVRGQVRLASASGDVVLHAGEQGIAEPGRAPIREPAPRLSHLVSWAREARHRDEHVIEPLHHGTLFARDPGVRSHPPWGSEYPLPITHLGLDIVVEDQVARVALDQTFRNDADQDLEGVYRFAIPSDAALQRLAMYVDGKLEESAVVERMQARRIYEELVYRRVDPALLEWAGTGRLSLRVYPLPAHQDKRLMLAYTQSLPKLYDDWTLTVPLPEVDQPVGELDVAMRIKGCADCELTSTSHQIEVTRDGKDAIIHYKHASEKIGDSFVVHVRDPRTQTRVATTTDGGERYLMVRAPADLGHTAAPYHARTWVLLDDVSASRSAMELRAQSDLIDAFLRELDENDKVAVIAFDVEARSKLAPTRVLDVDRKAVHASLGGEGGVGATDFGVALDAATKALAGVDPDSAMVVYLGDGMITAGARNLDALRAQLSGKAHFIGVGIGDGADTQTLGDLAAATGGYATTIDLADDVAWRAFDLVAALHTRRVTDLSARLVGAGGTPIAATAYLGSSQLADGEELELVAKLASAGAPAALELTGRRSLDGAPWHKTIALDVAPHDNAGYLPRLWAQRHIAARLLAKHEPVVMPPCTGTCPTEAELREQRDEGIRKEIVALGKRYFLLSRHTSLLVLENDDMYAKYGVTKGAGDTWAPYAMPATIAVSRVAAAAPPPSDAEIVREPLQVFYVNPYDYGGFDDIPIAAGQMQLAEGRMGWRGERETEHSVEQSEISTRGVLGLRITDSSAAQGIQFDGHDFAGEKQQGQVVVDAQGYRDLDRRIAGDVITLQSQPTGATVTIDGVTRSGPLPLGGGGHKWRGRTSYDPGMQPLYVQRLGQPGDLAFDDVTTFVPGLVRDAADAWRDRLKSGGAGTHRIDDKARALLDEARRRLAIGIYRWDGVELAIDGAHHLGWRRTTEHGLAETGSYDGTTWTRRYAELGLDVTRAVSDDDIALGFAYLPVWIADAAHYTHWFDVTSRGPRELALSNLVHGKDRVAFVLRFDDRYRLISVRDGNDVELIAITWGDAGPIAARVDGEDVPAGFSGEAIADAAAWAHGASQPGVVVELPQHPPAYWQDHVAHLPAGSAEWRHDERQLLASYAANGASGSQLAIYEELHAHGGVERGDLALAGGGVAREASDEQFASLLAPLAREPLARYLIADRAYARSGRPERLAPETRDGLIGALWSLRAIDAEIAASHGKAAADLLIALGDRAPAFRVIAAAVATSRWDLGPDDIGRMWDACAVGSYRNIARAQAALAMFNRGKPEAGADRLVALIDQLDLTAPPAQLAQMQYMITNTRRGQAGWQLAWATWRDRVLASSSFPHVMALAAAATQTADLSRVLDRAFTLAGNDPDRRLDVARAAVAYDPTGAAAMLDTLLKQAPSRELYQLAGQLALGQNHWSEALADLETAQDLGADEAVDINIVRQEMGQLIQVASTAATQGTGAAREHAIQRALAWGQKWRAIDPGNTQIDTQLGELMLSVGDTQGAWRQLSSTIERDPWSGTGYMTVADAFERRGKVSDALPFWQQAIVIDQTNPTPRLRKARALFALGRTAEGNELLHQITGGKWHDTWSSVVYQAQELLKQR